MSNGKKPDLMEQVVITVWVGACESGPAQYMSTKWSCLGRIQYSAHGLHVHGSSKFKRVNPWSAALQMAEHQYLIGISSNSSDALSTPAQLHVSTKQRAVSRHGLNRNSLEQFLRCLCSASVDWSADHWVAQPVSLTNSIKHLTSIYRSRPVCISSDQAATVLQRASRMCFNSCF